MITFKPIDSINEIKTQIKHFSEREIKKDEFSITNELIGTGWSSKVYKGKWNGAAVAIKVFYSKTLTPDLEPEFDPYWKTDNEHLIQLHGICKKPRKFAMIMELMDFNLNAYLKKIPENELVPAEVWMLIESSVAKALEYLHDDLKYAHKNIKGANVLLKWTPEGLIVKLSDFGLSTFRIKMASGTKEATLRYRALETFTKGYSTKRSSLDGQMCEDIYGYGMLLWQMGSKKKPFFDQSELEVNRLLEAGTRPEFENWPNWSNNRKALMSKCFSLIPSDRPKMREILKIFQKERENIIFTIFMSRSPGNVFSEMGMQDLTLLIKEYLFRKYLKDFHSNYKGPTNFKKLL